MAGTALAARDVGIDDDTIAHRPSRSAGTDNGDATRVFMTENDATLRGRVLARRDVEVRSAQSRRFDREEQLSFAWTRIFPLDEVDTRIR